MGDRFTAPDDWTICHISTGAESSSAHALFARNSKSSESGSSSVKDYDEDLGSPFRPRVMPRSSELSESDRSSKKHDKSKRDKSKHDKAKLDKSKHDKSKKKKSSSGSR